MARWFVFLIHQRKDDSDCFAIRNIEAPESLSRTSLHGIVR
jgi:hypothetical protein